MNLPKIIYLEQTSRFCPTQYEGKMEDGRVIYIRYLWGKLSYGVRKNLNDCFKEENYKYLCEFGDEYDSSTTIKVIRSKMSEVFDFSKCKVNNLPKTDKRARRWWEMPEKKTIKVKKSPFDKYSKPKIKKVKQEILIGRPRRTLAAARAYLKSFL